MQSINVIYTSLRIDLIYRMDDWLEEAVPYQKCQPTKVKMLERRAYIVEDASKALSCAMSRFLEHNMSALITKIMNKLLTVFPCQVL